METKIKTIGYGIASAMILTAPIIVAAQFLPPAGTSLPEGTLFNIITNAMMWLLAIVGIIGVIGFAIAGILYLTATGDEDRIVKAKSAMLASIVGVIVALVGLVIMRAVQTWLGGAEKRF